MKRIKLDTESVGLVGPTTLIQYQIEDEPIELWEVWKNPVKDTLKLIEMLMDHKLCCYNMSHDAFQLAKCYNTFTRIPQGSEPTIQDVFNAEEEAWKGKCLKPQKSIDLLMWLKETKFQFLHPRKQIIINNVPIEAADWLMEQLNKLKLNDLLFANYITKEKGKWWSCSPSTQKGFVNFSLKFRPSMKLKKICQWLFNIKVIGLDPAQPPEYTWRPYGGLWPKYLPAHVKYWAKEGRSYAIQDIELLSRLINWLAGYESTATIQPNKVTDVWEEDHPNSELAWMVGVCRQRGFSIDHNAIDRFIKGREKRKIPTDPNRAMFYLREVADDVEKLALTSTNKKVLIALMKLDSPLGQRAKEIFEERGLEKQLQLLSKLRRTNRFYADFNVIGTFSNRMSGTGGINPQGINRVKEIRELFPLADHGLTLSGGDFVSQETTIAAEVYDDEQLRNDIRADFDLHGFAAGLLFDNIECEHCGGEGGKCCDGKGIDKEKRFQAKNKFVFADFFGSNPESIARNTGWPLSKVKEAYQLWEKRYQGKKRYHEQMTSDFCSMTQPGGLGTKVIWKPPKHYAESLFGYRRYFTIENNICHFLFNLADSVWRRTKNESWASNIVVRKKKEQKASGATSSALFAAAFNVMSKNLRAAINHKIQSTGGTCTKITQLAIWAIQPEGVNPWIVQPFNVHDEIMVPNSDPELVKEIVEESVDELKKVVPLIKMDWKTTINDWSEK